MYYDDGKIRVRNATKQDVSLCEHMRKSDVEEIWASHHIKPYDAIKDSIEKSIFCATVENGSPIAVFGIYTDNIIGTKANVWLLATEDLTKIQMRFLKYSKKFIQLMLEYYPYLENYVDDRNVESIKWLRYCGATIEDPKPYGVEGKLFRHFYFKRS